VSGNGHRLERSDEAAPGGDASPKESEADSRSPLERFRTAPRKSLSVTDLVSPAWCELQYWYTLSKHGRKRATKAMKAGTKVHKELEDQLYATVKVNIQTTEDAWGLRIWNVIQGLRTLRERGFTRELEVWGVIDGLPINGVIDEISHTCPDVELEAQKETSKPADTLPRNQATISEYFGTVGDDFKDAAEGRPAETDKIYLCDVKTRSATGLPKGASFRPTQMQLMLYHHLLCDLATGKVDLRILADRYKLDIEQALSDSFIAQIGGLNEEFMDEATTSADGPGSSQDSLTLLLAHNSLRKLWDLMMEEFQHTLPHGRDSIGQVLKVEYRHSRTGAVVGAKTFGMDERLLRAYLDYELQWWKGQRAAVGVVEEEAFKCHSCEFADECTWRLAKVEEKRTKFRLRKKPSG
jgi:exonuclease V